MNFARLALRSLPVLASLASLAVACGSSSSSPSEGTTSSADGGGGKGATTTTTTTNDDGGVGTTTGAAGGGAGKASVTGSSMGAALSGLTTALAESTSEGSGSGNGSALTITLTDVETCGSVTSGPTKNAKFLTLRLTDEGTDDAGDGTEAAPTAPGVYNADSSVGSKYAYVEFTPLDATCKSSDDDIQKWRSGTVTVTSLAGGVVSGSFDLTGGDISNGADKISGTFTTANCVGSAALYQPTSTSCN